MFNKNVFVKKDEIKKFRFLGIFAFIFLVMILRRPDILTNAQPWAEDGKIWMAGIYNNGFWSSLILPQNGYYQTISRLTYGASLLFGVTSAAFVSNAIAVSIRVMFCCFILTRRMSFAPIKYRIVAVAYLILMPNLTEGYVNITNIHWYLSMYLMAVVMSLRPVSAAWKVHDFCVLVISALSGPFVIFIAPCLMIKRIHERGGALNSIKKIDSFDVVTVLCCMIQIAAIMLAPAGARSSAPLDASVGMLIKIVSYRIVGGTFFRTSTIDFMPYNRFLCLFVFVLFAAPVIYYFFRGSWRYRIAFLFPVLMLGFALAKPMVSNTEPQWPRLFIHGVGERYFFVTNFVFFCFILYLIARWSDRSKYILPAVAIITLLCVSQDFRMVRLRNVHYKEDLARFEHIKPGEKMDVRINPPGWAMELIKK